ncbi:DUF6894 family protein [Methylobacterium radiotolerans]|uniref:DUF6894 family protein n=1 Tax=Methylobacterium radiotolerans TaxID=31998 RepID=UPI001F3A5D07|nr:hypothetical protein [Methylobacterium radiotolerans]UIY45583.1 hypothetical protein LZ599_31280 [Methylobacterium radiotolerans]
MSSLDDTGAELADWQEARIEAIRLADQIFRDEAQRITFGPDWRIEVADERGLVLFRFDFVALEAPALSGSHGE